MFKHILNMLINDRELYLWVTSQLLEVRSMLTHVDAMRNDAGMANVVLGPQNTLVCEWMNASARSRCASVKSEGRLQQTVDMIVHVPWKRV